MVSSVAACCVRSGYALSMGMTQQFFDFLSLVTLTFDLWPLTLTFELGRDFCTIYLSAKFDRPTFSRSEVIADKQTNKLTKKQTPLKTSTSLRYATPVGNKPQLSQMNRTTLSVTANVLQTKVGAQYNKTCDGRRAVPKSSLCFDMLEFPSIHPSIHQVYFRHSP